MSKEMRHGLAALVAVVVAGLGVAQAAAPATAMPNGGVTAQVRKT